MNLYEVGSFVQTAMRSDIQGDAPVVAVIGFRGQIKSLRVSAEVDHD
ncbi:hypothetical protein [Nocardioides sp.]